MRRYVRRLVGAGCRRARLRRRRQLRGHSGCPGRRRTRGGAAAARSAPSYALPRHQQGRLGGDSRRSVPGGHGGLRGPAGADPRGSLRGPRRAAGPPCRAHRRLGSAVRRDGRRDRRRPRLGGTPRRPPLARGGAAAGAPRARQRRGRRPRRPGRAPVAGQRPSCTRRPGRRNGGGAGHGSAIRGALRRRAADTDHRALTRAPGGRAATRFRGAADAAFRPARPRAGGGGGSVRRAAGCPVPAADRRTGRARQRAP